MAKGNTRDHWHVVVEDLAATVVASAYGHELHQKLGDRAARGRPISLALSCGKCAASMFFAVDRLYHNHLHPRADAPSIGCPQCGHSGAHHYNGVQ